MKILKNLVKIRKFFLLTLPLYSSFIAAEPLLDSEIVAMSNSINSQMIASNIQSLVAFQNRNTCSDNSGNVVGIGQARDWIRDQFAAMGLQTLLYPWTTTTCGGTTRTLHNVVAWKPGNVHPERLIVIGGHYDSRNEQSRDGLGNAPGANDSGSQTALLLAAAQAIATYQFDATLVFVAWSGEEQGLLGSRAFVSGYRTYFPNSTIELNLNADIVGGDNTVNDAAALQTFRLFSPGTAREISSSAIGTTNDTSPSRGIMRYVGYWGGAYVPGMSMLPQLREDRPGRGSDHQSFISAAIPGVRFIDPNENLAHQHTPQDLFEFVTPDYTGRVAQVMLTTAASIARAPTPPRQFTATRSSSTNVRLAWQAPASGAPVTSYVLAARTTSENFYRTRKTVPATTLSTTLNQTTDLGIPAGTSFFVSVAAVDNQGHESLFAYPEYRCTNNSCAIQSGSTNVTATR